MVSYVCARVRACGREKRAQNQFDRYGDREIERLITEDRYLKKIEMCVLIQR